MKNLLTKSPLIITALLITCTATLTGCNQYLSRHENITTFAGESLAANEAIMVVDTWPEGFDNTDIPTDGKRQAAAIKKYRNPGLTSAPPSSGGQIQSIVR